MQNIGSKLFGVVVIGLLATLVYVTVFSDGLGKAPEVMVTNNQGEEIALNKPKKPVLVNFWATSCPSCIQEMPDMAKMKQELGDRFELIAISMEYDPQEQVQKFVQANPYPFVFVMDKDGKIAKSFGDVLLTPTSFLIAPNGKIVYKQVGELHFADVTERIKQMSPQF
ncbi:MULTISPECIES: TlpA disulfide reductase family protein [Thiomicrorhabdus]|uniref:TlpA family protein disulfide reductase n=1 Tax=Thiomicrorhabdus xiamenensis TaxID=2739063 RepID=A0A7D4NQS4_9GAMM|nr:MULTISPECIES: TlpA disulfide reductase family protein [Thiomicrorhabdus]MBO1924234.1 TlpA family protein disulfide reductase [Thiomicrorhabdus sp. 6S3-12]QKI89471.1 TlpA family protein disulfide reductase [Thiomicrorhabdus xiamenensis]